MKEKYCISVDWLQVCCYGNQLKTGTIYGDKYTYEVRLTPTSTAMFNLLFEVRFDTLKVATVQQSPRSSSLKKGLTLIKIENRVLWSEKYISILYDMITAFHLQYKGITRIDLCYDCNRFFDGRDPGRFIRDFVSKSPLKKGGIYRVGSEKFVSYGSRSASSASKFSAIKFGSTNTKVVPYIYNKTLELQEKKDKPWIRDVWEKNGLVSTDECPVWRTEISIKCQGTDLLNMKTGELFRLSPNYLEHYDNLVRLFHIYAAKCLDFRQNTGQKLKRYFKKLCLFDTSVDITCKPAYISKEADCGRIEKVCYNVLDRLGSTYVDLASHVRQSICTTMDFLLQLSGLKSGLARVSEQRKYLDMFKCSRFLEGLENDYYNSLGKMFEDKSLLLSLDRPDGLNNPIPLP